MTSDDMDDVHEALLMAWAERDDALARIAALESQLAAQAWRPVTEEPTELGLYLVWNGKEYSLRSYMIFDLGTGEVYGPMWGDDYLYDAPITHWQPLPAPPQDAQ